MLKPEAKVGLLVAVSFLLVGYMSLKLAKGAGVFSSTQKHALQVSDASGIIENTAVKIAGVKVGVVSGVDLKGGVAVVTISIRKGLDLSQGAYAELKTDGILGSKHISLFNGDPGDPPLKSGDPVQVVNTGESIGSVMNEIGKVASSLNDVAEALKSATTEGTVETPIGRIVTNIEILTEDLAEISSSNKGRLSSIMDRLDGISSTLSAVLGEGNRERVVGAFDSAIGGLEKFDESLENVRSITSKLDRGEGTIGKLINDEETINGINAAVENLNFLLGGVRTITSSIDYHSEFLTDSSDVKSFIGLRLQPGLDRYYEIQVVQDPLGLDETKKIVRDGTSTDNFTETTTFEDKIKITALFAKNFYDLTLKGGLIESSGGFGLDYYLFNDKLRLSAEVFNFDDTNLRLFARWDVYHGIYVVGGANSLLSDELGQRSPFVGAGVFLTNEDIAALAGFLLR